MKKANLISVLTMGLLVISCGREFSAPPPAATISDFYPDHGFMDTALAICGNNFDPLPESNLVYFGTEAAEVLPEGQPEDAAPPPEFLCNGDLLWVRVPEMDEDGGVDLKVSTGFGQAVSPRPFTYDGPGHPVDGALKKKIDVRAGLWAVITPAESAAGAFCTIGVESNVLGIFEDHYGLHLDFGLCATPISAAPAVTGAAEYTLFISHLRFTPPPDFGTAVTLTSWKVNLLDLSVGVIEAPRPVDIPATSGRPFVPNQVWTFPRLVQPPLWIEHDVVVTHMSRAALAFVATDGSQDIQIVELPAQPLACDDSRQANLTPIVDLDYDPQGQDFYLALEGTNEIWRVPADTRVPRRVWPGESASDGYTDCSWMLSSLALRRSQLGHANLRVYAADTKGLRVIEMELKDVGPDETLAPALNVATFDAIPYDLATGQYPIVGDAGFDTAGERLYVATQNGLSILDVSDPTPLTHNTDFKPAGELAVPMNRGGSQSLARRATFDLGSGKVDTILFTDANRDQVLKINCGSESILQGDTATGSTFAQMATSYQNQRLYLSDAFSNTIHVIDRNSGLRLARFPIASIDNHPIMGLGAIGLASLRQPEHDLLLLPLTDLEDQESILRPGKFGPIAYQRIALDYPECGLTSGGLEVDDSVEEDFDQLDLVSWDLDQRQGVPVLVLTRYFDRVQPPEGGEPVARPGRVWCLEIDPDPETGGSLIRGPVDLCDPGQLGSEVNLVEPDPHLPVLVQVESTRTAEGRPTLDIRLRDLRDGVPGDSLLQRVEFDLAEAVTDLALLSRGRGGRLYQVFLALPRLGHVLSVTFDLDLGESGLNAIPVGGDPSLLSTSPDGHRLYVTHFFGGQVSVIRADCEPVGQCESVESSIDVDAWPGPVVFDDSGRAAYVVHYTSGDISWIE